MKQVRTVGESVLSTLQVAVEAITVLTRVAESIDVTGQQIVVGGRDLTAVTRAQERDTRELIEGGRELTEVAKEIEANLEVFRAVLPRLLEALETVDRLESEVETVAETIEPLQGAAERVGRVTKRLSRTPEGSTLGCPHDVAGAGRAQDACHATDIDSRREARALPPRRSDDPGPHRRSPDRQDLHGHRGPHDP